MDDPTGVQIAGERYEVLPQRIGRLRRKLTLIATAFSAMGEEGTEGAIDSAGTQLHELIRVFVPDFMPEYQFEGYASETAREQDQYDEQADRSPSLPELIELFEAVYQVNGAERLMRLVTGVVDPKVVRQIIRNEMVNWSLRRSDASPTLPSPNGESGSTPSTTPEPTTAVLPTTGSPSPGSSSSERAAEPAGAPSSES